jgi:hypothetical protein
MKNKTSNHYLNTHNPCFSGLSEYDMESTRILIILQLVRLKWRLSIKDLLIITRSRQIFLQHNNFNQAAEIKEKHNYQFIFKDEEHQGFLPICDRKDKLCRTVYDRFIECGFTVNNAISGFRKWAKSWNNIRNNGKT